MELTKMSESRKWRNRHAIERQSWAAGWFVSLLDARRRGKAHEAVRAATSLEALGIYIVFDEDIEDDRPSARRESGPEGQADG